MDTLLAFINPDWAKIGETVLIFVTGGGLTAFLQAWWTRKKERKEEEIVSFSTLSSAYEKLRIETFDRLKQAEDRLGVFQTKIDEYEKEIFDLKLIIEKQRGKIEIYEAKIAEYEARFQLQVMEIQQLKNRVDASSK